MTFDPSDDLHGLKILVVEDSLDVGEALKELLILLGASVIGPGASTARLPRDFCSRFRFFEIHFFVSLSNLFIFWWWLTTQKSNRICS
jgi:hypothetical protein